MKILFIGGTGRLSKDVAELALNRGHDLFLLTRGTNKRKLFVNDKYTMIKGNIRNVEECKKQLEGLYFDVIIDFLTFTVSNLKDTLEIIDGKYNQYVFISSATVYVPQNGEVISEETTNTGNSVWPYSYNKFLCENYLRNSCKKNYTIIRPYVTYGNTRVPYPLVPRNSEFEYSFLDRVKRGKAIPTFSEGKTITTLTHTRDFAKGVVGLFGNDAAYGETVHISNDITVTWDDVLYAIEDAYGLKIERVDFDIATVTKKLADYAKVLAGDKARDTRFDNSKIKRLVPDYSCDISLTEGIKEMVSFYEQHDELKQYDYLWIGSMDRVCKSKVSIKEYRGASFKDKVKYYEGYIGLFYFIHVKMNEYRQKIRK